MPWLNASNMEVKLSKIKVEQAPKSAARNKSLVTLIRVVYVVLTWNPD